MEYFDFKRTISRNEYWPRFLFVLFVGVLGSWSSVLLQTPVAATYLAAVLGVVTPIFVAVALFCMAAQRANDLEASPWLALLALVPVVNVLFLILIGFMPKRA